MSCGTEGRNKSKLLKLYFNFCFLCLGLIFSCCFFLVLSVLLVVVCCYSICMHVTITVCVCVCVLKFSPKFYRHFYGRIVDTCKVFKLLKPPLNLFSPPSHALSLALSHAAYFKFNFSLLPACIQYVHSHSYPGLLTVTSLKCLKFGCWQMDLLK